MAVAAVDGVGFVLHAVQQMPGAGGGGGCKTHHQETPPAEMTAEADASLIMKSRRLFIAMFAPEI